MNSDSNLPADPQSELPLNPRTAPPADLEAEIVRATSAGQGMGVTAIVLMIVFAACIGGWMLTKSNLHLSIGMTTSPKVIAGIRTGFSALALLVAVLSIFLVVTGFRVIRQRRSPLAGAMVWRDTRVIRGNRARTTGLVYMAAGVVSFIAGITLAIYIWNVLQKVVDVSVITLRPGVTILQQPTVIPK
jgi:hypothetical protein